MSWQDYVKNLIMDGSCMDAAIVGHTENKYVWASHLNGTLGNISVDEIDVLMGTDRASLFTSGLTLGKTRCSVIRDNLSVEDDFTMDLRTKSQGGEPTFNVCVGKTRNALVIAMAKDGVHGGIVCDKVHKMVTDLRKQNC